MNTCEKKVAFNFGEQGSTFQKSQDQEILFKTFISSHFIILQKHPEGEYCSITVGVLRKLLISKNLNLYQTYLACEKISDLLWNLPQGFVDRTNVQTLNKLEIGKITTIKVEVIKYNFPRIRNLPNKVICKDNKGIIEIIFFSPCSL